MASFFGFGSQKQSSAPTRDDTQLPPLIGQGHKPGVAADGTVLQSIEIAVEKHVKAKPTIRMKEMLLIVEDFPVVRADGRQICPYYLDDCIHHFSRASDDESHSGGSVAASLEQTEARSAILSREGSQRTAPTSTELEQPSTLALDDLTRHIELVLSNDVSRPVTSALRNGFKSYISPNIIERHHLNVVGTNPEVSIELRCQINGKTRSRSYRVPRCSFRVRDGLETDLAIGWTVLKQLEKQVGSTEDSWDPNESSEDEEAFRNSHRRSVSGDAKTSTYAGSSATSSGGNDTVQSLLDTINRIMDRDPSARNDLGDSHTGSPERSSRSRRRR